MHAKTVVSWSLAKRSSTSKRAMTMSHFVFVAFLYSFPPARGWWLGRGPGVQTKLTLAHSLLIFGPKNCSLSIRAVLICRKFFWKWTSDYTYYVTCSTCSALACNLVYRYTAKGLWGEWVRTLISTGDSRIVVICIYVYIFIYCLISWIYFIGLWLQV